ncbi:MAG: hypothetical protein ACLFSQ_06125 [Candidatus Zixiibacteriota bacterium]
MVEYKESNTIKNEAPCILCKNNKLKGKPFYEIRPGKFACDAFPNGIPYEIINGDNQHEKPLPEQENGIVFEMIE